MSVELELESIFGQGVLAALDARMRAIAQEARGESGDEWLSVKQACEVTNLSAWHIRQFAKKLLAEKSDCVYQPNRGRPPLRIRRSALTERVGSLGPRRLQICAALRALSDC